MRKIRIRVYKCDSKLKFVKLVKECTGLGLKPSKDIADELFDSPGLYKEISLQENKIDESGVLQDYYKKFITEIHDIGDFQINGGLAWERNLKMLSLGVGDLEEYTSFLSEYMSLNSLDDNKIILQKIISKLKKEDLIEIVENIKI
jgi:hypothetical protein